MDPVAKDPITLAPPGVLAYGEKAFSFECKSQERHSASCSRDVFVHFEFLARSDFVAGAVNREPWTRGSFSEFGRSDARERFVLVSPTCLCTFVATRTGRPARCES